MPPVAITVTYVAAKGISLSKVLALSPAIDIGITRNPIITKSGVGTRKTSGINLKKYKSKIEATVTGKVRRAAKNIRETYVSG